MSQPTVRPAAPRDPIDVELQAVMAESLALALREAYLAWLRAILACNRCAPLPPNPW